MVKIRQVAVTALDKPKQGRPAARELSPRTQARLKQERQFRRMLGKLADPEAVFEVRLEADEKPLTVRQRLLRSAQEEGKEIVVRKSETGGWLVALATPERRSRRGRRRAADTAAGGPPPAG